MHLRYYAVTPTESAFVTSKKNAIKFAESIDVRSIKIYKASTGILCSAWLKQNNGKWYPIEHEAEVIELPAKRKSLLEHTRPGPEWLTAVEYAALHNVLPATVYVWLRAHAIKFQMVGTRQHRWIHCNEPRPHQPKHHWSNEHAACVECKETTWHHQAKGLCRSCYLKQYRSQIYVPALR